MRNSFLIINENIIFHFQILSSVYYHKDTTTSQRINIIIINKMKIF